MNSTPSVTVTVTDYFKARCDEQESRITELERQNAELVAKLLDDVLAELAKELPASEQECPRHWDAYREKWGLRKFVVESCIGRIKKLQPLSAATPHQQSKPHPECGTGCDCAVQRGDVYAHRADQQSDEKGAVNG